jgi:hypothetical protein
MVKEIFYIWIAVFEITKQIRYVIYVLNKGKDYDYSCFNDKFYNDWNALEIETEQEING